jgi:hypothetical protein
MRRLALLAALAGLAAAPAGASAQAFAFFGNGHPTSAFESVVTGRGHLVVDFHGDASAGCAELHVCDVSGTVTWTPGRRDGILVAYGYRKQGKHVEAGFLGASDEPGDGDPPGTSARVRRADGAGDALCADVGPSDASSNAPPQPGTAITLSLLGDSEVLRSRCAGPLTSDVSSLLPSRTIDESALRHGGAKLDFSADGQFAAHGLAGTLHSDVVLSVKKGRDALAELAGQTLPPGPRGRRNRYIEVTYRIESVSGQVVTSVHGLSDPDLCGPLDSCGLLGTVTAAPSLSKGEGTVSAFASAKHSRADLRRAVGLLPGPVPRGVHRAAFFEWDDTGSVTSDLARDGAPGCSDSVPLAGGGLLDVRFARDHATAHYYGGGGVSGGDALRTRCPGPSGADAGSGLALGTVPLRQFGARDSTLRLTRGVNFSTSGYRSSTKSSLTIAIRRMRIRERVRNDPAF